MNNGAVEADSCRKFISSLLASFGVRPPRATRWADLLVETSLLGCDTHGVRMLERYVKHIEDGGIDVSAEPEIVSDRGACVLMDGRSGLGHLAAETATKLAVERAKAHGLACVGLTNGNHVGACGLYVRQAAAADCVGLFAGVSRPGIAPWGGTKPMVGINPLAVAAPIESKPPFVLDMATSITAMGKITKARDLGESIPPGWAMDKDGKATTNPAEAVVGSLLPIGGYKGFGLAMVMEILGGVLTGGKLAGEVNSWILQSRQPTGAGFTIVTIDIAAFVNPEAFRARMRRWVEELTASPKRPGTDRIYYPGEMEGETRKQRVLSGIPLAAVDQEMFKRLAERFGLENPLA